MMNYDKLQQTTLASPADKKISHDWELFINPTHSTGEKISGYYPTSAKIFSVFAKVNAVEKASPSLREQVWSFVDVFAEALSLPEATYTTFPPIHLEVDDDSVFLEWVFNADFRIGFTLTEDVASSSWFMFKKNGSLTGSLSGELKYEGRSDIVKWLVLKAVENT